MSERDIVDEDFDSKMRYTKSSVSMGIGGTLRPAMSRAYQAYFRANPHQSPSTVEELLPYFDAPVDEAKLREIWPSPQ